MQLRILLHRLASGRLIRRLPLAGVYRLHGVTGSLVLASTGLLDGRRVTTHWGALDRLETAGCGIKVDRENRFVDDGIVTSAGVAAGIDMAFYMVEHYCGREVANETAHYIDYPR